MLTLAVSAMVRNQGAIGVFYPRKFYINWQDADESIRQRDTRLLDVLIRKHPECEFSHIVSFEVLGRTSDSQAQDPGTLPEIGTPSGSDGVIGIDKSGDLVYNT